MITKKTDLTAEQVRELFHYEPETGSLIWKKLNSRKIRPGSPAGCRNDIGYMKVKINYQDYKVHRVIWLYVYGTFPKDTIDHINGDKTDNRLVNLRDVTFHENMNNRRRRDGTKFKDVSMEP